MQVAGGVLAGGHSSRFGSNKALYCEQGRTFLQQALRTLSPLCDELLISASHRNAAEYSEPGARIVTDLHEECGALGGIEALLTASQAPWLMILTCDMPRLTTKLLQKMTADTEGVDAVTFEDYPFPMLISRRALPVVTQQINDGNYRVKALLSRLAVRRLPVADPSPFVNINRLSDISHTE